MRVRAINKVRCADIALKTGGTKINDRDALLTRNDELESDSKQLPMRLHESQLYANFPSGTIVSKFERFPVSCCSFGLCYVTMT